MNSLTNEPEIALAEEDMISLMELGGWKVEKYCDRAWANHFGNWLVYEPTTLNNYAGSTRPAYFKRRYHSIESAFVRFVAVKDGKEPEHPPTNRVVLQPKYIPK